MLLKKLAEIGLINNYQLISSENNFDVKDIVLNDKISNEQSAFVAIKGFKTDGHSFIKNAYDKGCRNFIVEYIPDGIKNILQNSSVIKVEDSRLAMAMLSCALFGYPSNKLKVIGITGTKGKTTVSTLLYEFLSQIFKTSLFSTVKNIIAGIEKPTEKTTVESNELQKLLASSLNSGDSHSVVEVSSHGVTLKRVAGINWDIGVFTSFSQDHLDLYGTMENYFQAKLDFFRLLNSSNKENKLAVINIDDPKGEDVVSVLNKSVKPIRVGSSINSDYRISDVNNNYNGVSFKLTTNENVYYINSKMRGLFNVTNIALATATALNLGIDFYSIDRVLKNYSGIEGRFEIVIEKPFFVIVDFAHTPDSLQKILDEARKLTDKKVILVFGCPGERDREKRPIMGKIAANTADFSIITNDDTYQEDEKEIAKEIENGFISCKKIGTKDYEIILDRKKAIFKALSIAKEKDVVVIAGMGHQRFQHLKERVIEHSDKDTVLNFFKEKRL